MNLGLAGKVALVTAASRGLGRAVALRLAQEGAHVAICARGEAQLEEAASEIRSTADATILPLVADVAGGTAAAELLVAEKVAIEKDLRDIRERIINSFRYYLGNIEKSQAA